jgi:hypothetical protein
VGIRWRPSLLTLGSFSIQRGLAAGLRFGASYTLAKSMDNASSLGAGGAVVAQNDQDLEAEYALSNFDQRHQFSANATWELAVWRRAEVAHQRWRAVVTGRRVVDDDECGSGNGIAVHAACRRRDHQRGEWHERIAQSRLSRRAHRPGRGDAAALLQHQRVRAAGDWRVRHFTAQRHHRAGGYVANAQFTRDMRIGGTRSVGLTINANNLFNTTRWQSIDTNVNSSTFGQVTRFAPMRTITVAARIRF